MAKNKFTLCIDINNTLVRKVTNMRDIEEIFYNISQEDRKNNYIFLHDENMSCEQILCPKPKYQGKCSCRITVYRIRKYTFELLRMVKPYFELIMVADVERAVLSTILTRFENIMNKPIRQRNR